ncbi:MAG: hypothetical protein ACK4SQ_16135 [Allorhizobium sp.]
MSAAGLSRRLFAVAANESCTVAAGFPFSPCADLFSQPRQLPGVLRFPDLRGFAVADGGPHRMRCPLRAFLLPIAALRPYPWRLLVARGRAVLRLRRLSLLLSVIRAHAGLRELFHAAALSAALRPITE